MDLGGGACIVHPVVNEGGTIQGVIASVKISDDGCGSQQYPLTVQVIIGCYFMLKDKLNKFIEILSIDLQHYAMYSLAHPVGMVRTVPLLWS